MKFGLARRKILNKAFTAATTGQQGDFGRNVLRAFGSAQAGEWISPSTANFI